MASSTSQKFYQLEKTPDEERAELQAASEPVVKHGVPAAVFDRDQAMNKGFTLKTFTKYVKFVSAMESQTSGLLNEALAAGMTHLHLYSNPGECTFENFIDLVRFLRSKEGQDYLCGAETRMKLRAKAAKLGRAVTAKDFTLLEAFEMQRQEYHAAIKAIKARHHEKLARIEAEMKRLEEEQDKKLKCLEEERDKELKRLEEHIALASHSKDSS